MDGAITRDRDSNGNLYVRYLYWNDGKWNWNYNWLDNKWDDQNLAAVSASPFIAPPRFPQGSFVLRAVRAIRRAFFRSPRAFPISRYTFCYRAISSPKAQEEVF
jgi:hypothetical protein